MIEYQKEYVSLINNEKIAYIKKGSGPNLLLIHGNMASSVHMVELMDQLKENYTVIAPDLRSFGDSSFNNNFTSLKELAFDLILFLEKLKIKETFVVGWSTGFGVAMELAILNPKLVRGLLSLEGMSIKGYYSLKTDNNNKILSHRIYQSFNELKKDKELNFVHEALLNGNYPLIKNVWENTLLVSRKITGPLLDLYVKETLKQRSQANINWCWVNFNISDDSNLYSKGTSEYHQIKCPVIITLGLIDNVVTEPMIMENIDAFKESTLYTFPNAGHCVHFDELTKIVEIINLHF